MALARTSIGTFLSSASAVSPKPGAGAAPGNLGIIIVETAHQSSSCSWGAITTNFGFGTAGAAGATQGDIYYNTGISSTDISSGVSVGDSGDHQGAIFLTYSGHNTTTPYVYGGGHQASTATTSVTTATLAASDVKAGDILLCVIVTDRDSNTTSTNTSGAWAGITGIPAGSFIVNESTATGAGGGIIVNELVVGADATGTVSFSCSITSSAYVSYLFVIKQTAASNTLTASSGSFTETGSAATLKTARLLTASAASYALSGSAGTLKVTMPASAGSFSLTGAAPSLLYKRIFTSSAGSYVLSGSAATLNKGFRLTASAASFALTGSAATFTTQRKLTASAANYTLAGAAVTLRVTINTASGSFTLSGSAASLLKGTKLAASAGSFTLSGATAALLRGRVLAASAGAYALTGKPANLLRGIRLSASAGSFAETGASATLTKAGPASFTLTASSGAFAFSGSAASLLRLLRLTASHASYILTGFVADGVAARRLSASVGDFVIIGQDAALTEFSPNAKTYPLAGIVQTYPGTSQTYVTLPPQTYPSAGSQTYPLEGESQDYPLRGTG
jgi:hypothetical protein